MRKISWAILPPSSPWSHAPILAFLLLRSCPAPTGSELGRVGELDLAYLRRAGRIFGWRQAGSLVWFQRYDKREV